MGCSGAFAFLAIFIVVVVWWNWPDVDSREGCGYLTPDRMDRIRTGDIGPNDRWHDLGFFGARDEAMLEARRRLRPDRNYGDFVFCPICLG